MLLADRWASGDSNVLRWAKKAGRQCCALPSAWSGSRRSWPPRSSCATVPADEDAVKRDMKMLKQLAFAELICETLPQTVASRPM